jgi:hypothetical protein
MEINRWTVDDSRTRSQKKTINTIVSQMHNIRLTQIDRSNGPKQDIVLVSSSFVLSVSNIWIILGLGNRSSSRSNRATGRSERARGSMGSLLLA